MTQIKTIGMTLVLATLAGCATKAGNGALIGGGGGALVGGGIGALAGGKKGALVGGAIGAGVGAGAGALIGHYMDKQEAALKDVKGAKVERQGDQLLVKFNSAILFDTGKAELKPQSKKDLTEFAKVLKEYKDTDLVIEGHTDNTGKKEKNQTLSEARAQSVVALLQSEGVEKARLTSKGYGDSMPVGDNKTDDGRQQNRRVQVQIAANEELKKQDAQNAQQQQGQSGQAAAQPAATPPK
jgi:outer membrane protein OmpA-like peptidoglycan-associated protein